MGHEQDFRMPVAHFTGQTFQECGPRSDRPNIKSCCYPTTGLVRVYVQPSGAGGHAVRVDQFSRAGKVAVNRSTSFFPVGRRRPQTANCTCVSYHTTMARSRLRGGLSMFRTFFFFNSVSRAADDRMRASGVLQARHRRPVPEVNVSSSSHDPKHRINRVIFDDNFFFPLRYPTRDIQSTMRNSAHAAVQHTSPCCRRTDPTVDESKLGKCPQSSLRLTSRLL